MESYDWNLMWHLCAWTLWRLWGAPEINMILEEVTFEDLSPKGVICLRSAFEPLPGSLHDNRALIIQNWIWFMIVAEGQSSRPLESLRGHIYCQKKGQPSYYWHLWGADLLPKWRIPGSLGTWRWLTPGNFLCFEFPCCYFRQIWGQYHEIFKFSSCLCLISRFEKKSGVIVLQRLILSIRGRILKN